MPNMSNALENKLLDMMFRGQTGYTPPINIYIGLFTSPCTDASPGTEVTAPSYVRGVIPCLLSTWSGTNGPNSTAPSTGTSGTIFNISAVTFPDPQEEWGTVTHVALFDASTGGNYLFWASLATPRDFIAGDVNIKFRPSELSVQIDN